MNAIANDVERLLPLLPKVSPLLPKIAGGRSDFSLNFDSSLSPASHNIFVCYTKVWWAETNNKNFYNSENIFYSP